jgi:hypothetical protein
VAEPADRESALVVPVTAAGRVVEELREELDPASVLGVPAHVTVLYPFLTPDAIDARLVLTLADLFAPVPSFRFSLASVGWFGRDVVWLRPEPDEPFCRLTELVTGRWPELQPYGGAYDQVIPHLTVGDLPSDPRLHDAARQVGSSLPIACLAGEVWLMTGSTSPGSWTTRSRFPLADK